MQAVHLVGLKLLSVEYVSSLHVYCSPCLKLKPVSKSVKSNYLTVNVETYGGGLWHTWFDRDLSVAGRVLIKKGDQLQHKLVSALPNMFANL